ncbi:MAG: MFS transporter [Pseudomonadota bacterium]
MTVFFLQPLAFGGWLALIPEVKEALSLSKGQLALALMGVPIALVPGLQIAGYVIGEFGPRRVAMIFFPLQAFAFLLPFAAWNTWTLFAALFVVGLMMAFVEVAMNVYAGRLEKREGVLIMNRCHGFWALGLMVGSGVIVLASAGYTPQVYLALVSAVAGALSAYALRPMRGEGEERAPPRRKPSQLPTALVLIAVFMFLVTLTEGVMADWAAVHMAERLGESGSRAALAVTIFSALMATGRFLGDILKRRLGAVLHARATVACAIVGLVVIVAPLPTDITYFGFALVGFGVSAAYPLGVSAIAALDDRYEAPNIAFAATVAMGGFLIGPPLIGFLSESYSLAVAVAALIPGMGLAFFLSRWLATESGR